MRPRARNTVWDGERRVDVPDEHDPAAGIRYRPRPTLEPLEDSGEFREWFRRTRGKDPVTKMMVVGQD